MNISTLLADPEAIRLDYIRPSLNTITLVVKTSQYQAPCARAAIRSKLQEFVSFAHGLSEDYEAVRNALRYQLSNRELEGQVNRLQLIKRQMYGRTKFDLLQARVFHSI